MKKIKSISELSNQDGALLVISLIVLGVIALSSIYLSLIMLQEIKSTRFADNAIVAHYVAETGAEEALWRLKIARDEDDVTFFNQFEGNARCAAEAGTLGVGCIVAEAGTDPERIFDYQTLSTAAEKYETYDIARNGTAVVETYDPEKILPTGINQFNVEWFLSQSECNSQGGSARLEITYTPIQYSSIVPESSRTVVDICGAGQPCDVDFLQNSCGIKIVPSLATDRFYRISLRPLDSAVAKIEITTDLGGVPSQIEAASHGEYRESSAKVTLRASWRDALSGIFNYVVFSEESIIKEVKTGVSSAFDSLCGFCSDSTPVTPIRCSEDPDCNVGHTCSIVNNAGDAIDGSDTQHFCIDSIPPETDGSSSDVSQSEFNSCNFFCSGLTYCGDNVVQLTNGAGGVEVCDDGILNSDIAPDRCRTSCVEPRCGDGVHDLEIWELAYAEECDDSEDNDASDECDTEDVIGGGRCRLTRCGDATIQNNPTNGAGVVEICDDGDGGNSCVAEGACCDCTSIVPPP